MEPALFCLALHWLFFAAFLKFLTLSKCAVQENSLKGQAILLWKAPHCVVHNEAILSWSKFVQAIWTNRAKDEEWRYLAEVSARTEWGQIKNAQSTSKSPRAKYSIIIRLTCFTQWMRPVGAVPSWNRSISTTARLAVRLDAISLGEPHVRSSCPIRFCDQRLMESTLLEVSSRASTAFKLWTLQTHSDQARSLSDAAIKTWRANNYRAATLSPAEFVNSTHFRNCIF